VLVTVKSEMIHKKYYDVAGISVEVISDLPFDDNTYASKFNCFEIPGPKPENIELQHHFDRKCCLGLDKDPEILYFRPPWVISRQDEKWVYRWIKAEEPYENYYQTVVANREHTRLDIYNDKDMREKFLKGGLTSLTMFPTDQILTSRLLAYRNGCIIHSVGMIVDEKGYLFVGHSDAGKSTIAQLMMGRAEILCDDRNIIRKKDGKYILCGTWSHGDVADVSSSKAPLAAIFFLKQAEEDSIQRLDDEIEIFESLLACLIRPLETRDWWEKSMSFLTQVSEEVVCCNLNFTKRGKVVDVIKMFNE
jgi:hypothetical protein